MARRELDALLGHEIEKRVMARRGGGVDGLDHALIGLRAGDRQNVGEALGDRLRLGAHAAGDDDLAILLQRRADRLQRLGLGAVQKAAGVHDHDIGPRMGARKLIAFGAQARENALAVDERLGAAERDEGDARRLFGGRGRVGGDVLHGRRLAMARAPWQSPPARIET